MGGQRGGPPRPESASSFLIASRLDRGVFFSHEPKTPESARGTLILHEARF